MYSSKQIIQFFWLAIVSLVLLVSNCSDSSEYGEASDYEKYGAAVSGTITGTVLTSSGSVLSGVSVNYFESGLPTATYSTSTDAGGDYSQTPVAIGSYTIRYTKPGYLTEYQYAELESGGETINLATLRMLSSSCTSGDISGTVTSALAYSTKISGAAVNVYRGIWRWRSLSKWNPSPDNTTNTASNGTYSLSSMPRGWYTLLFSKSGYITAKRWTYACGNRTRNAALSPTLPSNSMRIILSWPEISPVTVIDLDSHLTGPDNDSGRFHVYYDNKKTFYYFTNDYACSGCSTSAASDKVNLDRDEHASSNPAAPPGIETITVSNVKSSGTYRYSIHDFTNLGLTTPDNLSKSDATVNVDYNDGTTTITNTYNAPSKRGSLWEVFTFTTSGGFVEEGNMSDEEHPVNIP